MLKKFHHLFFILILVGLLVAPYFVFAQNAALNKLQQVQPTSGYSAATKTSAAGIAGTVVQAFLSLLGVIFLILIIYAGYTWMTAYGDESKVDKAKNTLRTSIIGLVIVLAAYSIYIFIFSRIIEVGS